MKSFAIIFSILFLVSCNSETETTTTSENTSASADSMESEKAEDTSVKSYGEKITDEGVINMESLLAKLESTDSLECKVTGEITSTCSKKGCWMTINSPDGEEMRVTFKDYGFFVPVSDQEGKTAIMRGKAKIETTSVDMLRHYAEDAGKSAEEIAGITEDVTNLAFEADGVLIQD